MSKQANPTLIGGFVAGAGAVAVVTALVLGGGKLWQQTRHFVAIFEGSLHGLSIGAPVTFRGVSIGSVTEITPIAVLHEGEPPQLELMVTLEVRRGVLHTPSGEQLDLAHRSDKDIAQLFDENGVRAQLMLQSMLTGQLYVDLDFYPGSPLNKVDVRTPYPQLATIETGLKKLGKAVQSLPIEQLANEALRVLTHLDQRINSPEVDQILASVAAAAAALEQTAKRIEAEFDPLAASIRGAADATAGAMQQAQQTLTFESGVPGEMATSLIGTMNQARETLSLEKGPAGALVARLTGAVGTADQALSEMRVAMSEAREILDDRSEARQRLEAMVDELAAAARSLRLLADYLERHPEALIQGKNPRR